MGFNYNALDSFEFETLARDVTEMITGVKLSCYTAGADGGVDASDFYYQKCQQSRVVMQQSIGCDASLPNSGKTWWVTSSSNLKNLTKFLLTNWSSLPRQGSLKISNIR